MASARRCCSSSSTLGTMAMRAAYRFLLAPRRLWWYLALLAALSFLTQEISRTSSVLAVAASAEFEGFGDDEADEEELVVLPSRPPPRQHQSFDTGDGFSPPPPTATPPSQQSEAATKKQDSKQDSKKNAEKRDGTVPKPQQRVVNSPLWDEDEFEGLPVYVSEEEKTDGDAGKEEEGNGEEENGNKTLTSASSDNIKKGPLGLIQSYLIEGASILFLIAFAATYFIGKKKNEGIALAFAAQFARKGAIFEKNFSLLGTTEAEDGPLLIKEGQTTFKFYASGRRYCEGLLATMELRNRHDLVSCLWNLVSPGKDELTIEVYMNSDVMDPITFAIARKKAAKAMQRDCKDLQQYSTLISSPPQGKWLAEELAVVSESREAASDLITDAVLDQVLGEKAFGSLGKHFISLHFSDQFPPECSKKILQFKFTLPDVKKMSEIEKLIAIVPYYIDLIGRYKLSAQSRSKAEAARARVAQEEAASLRQDALQRKKELKVDPQVLRKKEEKRKMKRSMPRVKMTRV